ncbi:AGAP001097-PA-like protein [Anopheles sinensis]|uniref:Elongation of very long chain fatty acids protein n=1 Tax=Anopheles sinensis TaxID=74873 RepID=A0A084WT58_ANOSI|nr:AGAP001097-PA-like protein [Anopheles sinensis]
MLSAVPALFEYSQNWFNKNRDVRSMHLPLADSPGAVLGIIAVYLYFVLIYGPRLMNKRKAYNLLSVIQAYNMLQIIANGAVFIKICYNVFIVCDRFSFRCQPIDFSTSNAGWDEVYISYAYFLLKLLDLIDTVFFVLRKKQSHVSFLHVYHHSVMVATAYCGLVFVPGGHALMLGLWNTLVHTVMYFYYFLASLGSANIWWKNYLTRLQLVQFVYLAIHFGQPLVDVLSQYLLSKWLMSVPKAAS